MANASIISDPSRDFSHIKDISNDKYLKKTEDILENIKFPNDFDVWSAQKQRDWVYNNLTELYQNMPDSLQNMIPAIFRPVDFDRSQEKLPEWMDMDKYRRGQKFVRDNYFSIIINIVMGAIYGFTFDDGLKTLILTRNSNTPYLSFIRYLSTILQMVTWYDGEPWVKGTKAYTDMQVTRAKHADINTKKSRITKEQVNAASKITNPLCSEQKLFLKDITATCPFENPE
ncbi:uncharacterized protein LOC105184299 [Harpegnathos saltator]|uniref:Uncharacterized protein n=1 Tax=Harpegnathos saltator TaxID=610380 RepID=E2BLX3_HARSA|nr:uncharacterized protein LOC105184299 [Harpegnathos saltator]EFN83303.1 hypothetical protein EAI_02249 [Harpegnathos saltator]